jgi:hypothetical protein
MVRRDSAGAVKRTHRSDVAETDNSPMAVCVRAGGDEVREATEDEERRVFVLAGI